MKILWILALSSAVGMWSLSCSKSDDSGGDDDKKTTGGDENDDDDDDNETGDSNVVGTVNLGMVQGTSEAAPSISSLTQAEIDAAGGESSSSLMPGTIAVESSSSLTTATLSFAIGDKFTPNSILNLFRYECHEQYEPSGENYCPADLVLPEKYEDSFYGFNSSLLAKNSGCYIESVCGIGPNITGPSPVAGAEPSEIA